MGLGIVLWVSGLGYGLMWLGFRVMSVWVYGLRFRGE